MHVDERKPFKDIFEELFMISKDIHIDENIEPSTRTLMSITVLTTWNQDSNEFGNLSQHELCSWAQSRFENKDSRCWNPSTSEWVWSEGTWTQLINWVISWSKNLTTNSNHIRCRVPFPFIFTSVIENLVVKYVLAMLEAAYVN